jgi:hydroxymethylbilane synthase
VTDAVRVGTRRSALARIQTQKVVERLQRLAPRTAFEVVPIETTGDRDLRPGTSPDFTDAIDRALAAGEVDLGVHSAKDLPVRLDPRLRLLACPTREDPRDALVQNQRTLPKEARVGSSSLRRRAQLLRWRSDLDVVELRGNVDTRLQLVESETLDAVILAVAGLRRLGREDAITSILPIPAFLPAPGQGALALVARAEDRSTGQLVSPIDDPATRAAVRAERAFALGLGATCQMPLAALARLDSDRLILAGEVLSADGRRDVSDRLEGAPGNPEQLGTGLAARLRARGAAELLRAAG